MMKKQLLSEAIYIIFLIYKFISFGKSKLINISSFLLPYFEITHNIFFQLY